MTDYSEYFRDFDNSRQYKNLPHQNIRANDFDRFCQIYIYIYINGQRTHGGMFNVFSFQENANKKQMRYCCLLTKMNQI